MHPPNDWGFWGKGSESAWMPKPRRDAAVGYHHAGKGVEANSRGCVAAMPALITRQGSSTSRIAH